MISLAQGWWYSWSELFYSLRCWRCLLGYLQDIMFTIMITRPGVLWVNSEQGSPKDHCRQSTWLVEFFFAGMLFFKPCIEIVPSARHHHHRRMCDGALHLAMFWIICHVSMFWTWPWILCANLCFACLKVCDIWAVAVGCLVVSPEGSISGFQQRTHLCSHPWLHQALELALR